MEHWHIGRMLPDSEEEVELTLYPTRLKAWGMVMIGHAEKAGKDVYYRVIKCKKPVCWRGR